MAKSGRDYLKLNGNNVGMGAAVMFTHGSNKFPMGIVVGFSIGADRVDVVFTDGNKRNVDMCQCKLIRSPATPEDGLQIAAAAEAVYMARATKTSQSGWTPAQITPIPPWIPPSINVVSAPIGPIDAEFVDPEPEPAREPSIVLRRKNAAWDF